MHRAKLEAIAAIERMPDNVASDEIVYCLYVLNKMNQGMPGIKDCAPQSREELEREIEKW